MNNQLPMHPMYTLPGIMHYLQTEFTKNERDRISWELERSEMKARIAQLEGENRDLRYRLMKVDPSAEPEILKPLDKSDASPLIKSKAAVQENVKEIIYLFKSPTAVKQMEYLNEKKDPVHELEKLGMNQLGKDCPQSFGDDQEGHKILEEHQVGALQDALHQEDAAREPDNKSDAGTVVADSGSENEESSAQGPRRHRSSSLFTSEKIKPPYLKKDESQEEAVSLVQGSVDRSAIIKLKVFQNQVLTYSRTGELNLRSIDQSLNWEKSSYRTFEGLASELLDFFWLDIEQFLTLDSEGIKLWHTTVESAPVVQLNIFGENLPLKEVRAWDFRNSWLLLALDGKIYLKEISISTDLPKLSVGKSYYFDTNKKILDARFGITEKSLIALNQDPDELVIYSFQGKQLQKVDIKKFLPSPNALNSGALLLLNKKSSKLLVLVQNLVLLYSFDQKKFVLKHNLKSTPSSVIFNYFKDMVVFAYEDGNIELRSVNDFDSIIKKYNHVTDESALDENTQSLLDSGLKPTDKNPIVVDTTAINNRYVIISADNSGRMRLNEIQELQENSNSHEAVST